MNKTTTRIITGLSLFALFISLFVSTTRPASAQTTTQSGTGQALEIGPPVVNLSGDPGQVITTNINIRDIAGTNLLVKSQINDFIASKNEDGTPQILLEEGQTSPYSFKSWLTPIPQMTLKPQEIRTVKVTITIPANASPGGYYGVIRFTGTPPELEGTGVSLSASLGSLVFITVNGEAKQGMEIEEFVATQGGTTSSLFQSAPVVFKERLKNTGNIHEKPSGLVTVKDMFGNIVATLGVNQPVKDILPNSVRKFESSLDSTNIGNKLLFGLYHAELSVNYGTGESKKTITSTISFWVIPYTLILFLIGLLVIVFFVLRFLIRRYNRHIITKSKNTDVPKKKK